MEEVWKDISAAAPNNRGPPAPLPLPPTDLLIIHQLDHLLVACLLRLPMYRLARQPLAAAVSARTFLARSISKTIFIKNLPHGITPDDLYNIYLPFGNVRILRVYNEFKVTYAMVIYSNMQAAIAAVDETNDTILFDKGRRVAVDFSKFNSETRGARLFLRGEKKRASRPTTTTTTTTKSSDDKNEDN